MFYTYVSDGAPGHRPAPSGRYVSYTYVDDGPWNAPLACVMSYYTYVDDVAQGTPLTANL